MNETVQKQDRFDIKDGDKTMKAVVTTGNGGFDKLEYREVPIPTLAAGEVLLQVLAAGVNNTEINTRLGWYSSSVTNSTKATADIEEKQATAKADGGWNEATPFPLDKIVDAQREFMEKKHFGKFVLIPPPLDGPAGNM
jgi:NADPH:quinone reductase-like Zn-dependent oxidoreductase